MGRKARIVAVDIPHHITQRGNYQQIVFTEDMDRKYYLALIQKYSEKYKLSIMSYCLMPNHVHFIAIPHEKDSMAKTFNAVTMRYSQYFNKKQGNLGHLWQSRFYSCILDEPHLIMAARYIERNPVRANMVQDPWNWKWSSSSFYANGADPVIKLKNLLEFIDMTPERWKNYTEIKDEESYINNIKKHTLTGYPLGAGTFLYQLEEKLGRKVIASPRGRPKVQKSRIITIDETSFLL